MLNLVLVHGIGLSQTERDAYGATWVRQLQQHGIPIDEFFSFTWESSNKPLVDIARTLIDIEWWSRQAQRQLLDALAFMQRSKHPVVVIAHSMGCVLAQFALQSFVVTFETSSDVKPAAWLYMGGPQSHPVWGSMLEKKTFYPWPVRTAPMSYFFWNNEDVVCSAFGSARTPQSAEVFARVSHAGREDIFAEHRDLFYLTHPYTLTVLRETEAFAKARAKGFS